jgi:hypothetical protein
LNFFRVAADGVFVTRETPTKVSSEQEKIVATGIIPRKR